MRDVAMACGRGMRRVGSAPDPYGDEDKTRLGQCQHGDHSTGAPARGALGAVFGHFDASAMLQDCDDQVGFEPLDSQPRRQTKQALALVIAQHPFINVRPCQLGELHACR